MLYMKVAKSKFWVPIIRNFFYFLILHLNQMIDISKSYCDNHFIIYMSKHCAVHLIQLYASYISIKLEGEKMSFTYIHFCCSVAVSNTLQPHGLQHTRLPCPSLSPRVCSNSYPLSWWCHQTISSSITHSSPALSLSQHQGLFKWVSSSHQVTKVLELQLQHQSFQWIFRTDSL